VSIPAVACGTTGLVAGTSGQAEKIRPVPLPLEPEPTYHAVVAGLPVMLENAK